MIKGSKYQKQDYVITCEKCEKDFTKNLTIFYFLNNRYKKVCQNCSSNRKSEEEIREIKIRCGKDSGKTRLKNFKKLSWDESPLSEKLRRVLEEQGGKCLICGIDNWLEKPISLEIDHIDGNPKNNGRENLRYLCPNCHSQTDTFRSKNTINKYTNYNGKNVSDDELLESFKSSGTIREALNNLGLSSRGANYKRMYDVLKK